MRVVFKWKTLEYFFLNFIKFRFLIFSLVIPCLLQTTCILVLQFSFQPFFWDRNFTKTFSIALSIFCQSASSFNYSCFFAIECSVIKKEVNQVSEEGKFLTPSRFRNSSSYVSVRSVHMFA